MQGPEKKARKKRQHSPWGGAGRPKLCCFGFSTVLATEASRRRHSGLNTGWFGGCGPPKRPDRPRPPQGRRSGLRLLGSLENVAATTAAQRRCVHVESPNQ